MADTYPYHGNGYIHPVKPTTIEMVFQFQGSSYATSGIRCTIHIIGTCTNDDATYKMLEAVALLEPRQ